MTGEGLLTERVEEEKSLEWLPCCDDPKEFLNLLRETLEYQKMTNERSKVVQQKFQAMKEELKEELPPTREEVAQVFEGQEEFKQLFWDFYQDVLHLGYKKEKYSPDFRKAFNGYRLAVKESFEAVRKGKDQEKMFEKDRLRSLAHNEAARILVDEGIAPTELLARVIVRAFLVDIGCDYIPSARQADQLRILRSLPDRTTLVKFLMESRRSKETGSVFSLERATGIQEEFFKVHQKEKIDFVKRKNFFEEPADLSGCLPPQGNQE